MNIHYSIAGWHVASAAALPALPVAPDGRPEIVVEMVEAKPQIAVPIASDAHWAVGPRDWLVRYDAQGYAARVEEGRRVSLWAAGGDLDLIASFLPGPAFAALAYMRGRTPLHGSALALPQGTVIVLGDSGAGKSTLATALAARGHLVVADDLAVPDLSAARPALRPAFPRLRAYHDVLAHFGLEGEPARGGKFRLPVPAGLEDSPRPIAAIVVLGPRQKGAGRLERLAYRAAAPALLRHRWAPQCALWYGVQECSFRDCARLAEAVPVFAAQAPDGFDRLDEFCARLEEGVARGA